MIDLEKELEKPMHEVLDLLLLALEERVLPDEQHGLLMAIEQTMGRFNNIVERIMSHEAIQTPPKTNSKGDKKSRV